MKAGQRGGSWPHMGTRRPAWHATQGASSVGRAAAGEEARVALTATGGSAAGASTAVAAVARPACDMASAGWLQITMPSTTSYVGSTSVAGGAIDGGPAGTTGGTKGDPTGALAEEGPAMPTAEAGTGREAMGRSSPPVARRFEEGAAAREGAAGEAAARAREAAS